MMRGTKRPRDDPFEDLSEIPLLPRVLHTIIISHFHGMTLVKMRIICKQWQDLCYKRLFTDYVPIITGSDHCDHDKDEHCSCCHHERLRFYDRTTMTLQLSLNLPNKFNNDWEPDWNTATLSNR